MQRVTKLWTLPVEATFSGIGAVAPHRSYIQASSGGSRKPSSYSSSSSLSSSSSSYFKFKSIVICIVLLMTLIILVITSQWMMYTIQQRHSERILPNPLIPGLSVIPSIGTRAAAASSSTIDSTSTDQYNNNNHEEEEKEDDEATRRKWIKKQNKRNKKRSDKSEERSIADVFQTTPKEDLVVGRVVDDENNNLQDAKKEGEGEEEEEPSTLTPFMPIFLPLPSLETMIDMRDKLKVSSDQVLPKPQELIQQHKPQAQDTLVDSPSSSSSSSSSYPKIGTGKKAFLFTMDSLAGYVLRASQGGAAGELIVREALTWALVDQLGYTLTVADSDQAMFQAMNNNGASEYDLLFFDPWTLVDPSNHVRPFLKGREEDVFVLAFFGWNPEQELRAISPEFRLHPSHVLTAYPMDDENHKQNTFLGFIVKPNAEAVALRLQQQPKEKSGVVWGKKAEYFQGREEVLTTIARTTATLHVASKETPLGPPGGNAGGKGGGGVVYHGTLDREGWLHLLSTNKFLLGLGNPLLGPSALDAIAAGCMYLDPTYDGEKVKPLHDAMLYMGSQHPYLRKRVGEPYVCTVDLTSVESVIACVEKALNTDLEPYVPDDFTAPEVVKRVYAFVKDRKKEGLKI